MTSAASERGADDVSRAIGGLVGPSLMAIIASEFPLVQPGLYDQQIPPVVYISGTLLFIAGLAIVRAHNRWVWAWPVLITLVGWAALVLGLVRMFVAARYVTAAGATSSSTFMVIEAVLFAVGALITANAWRRR
jgi:energy-converting hydrogenase Eha subunit C